MSIKQNGAVVAVIVSMSMTAVATAAEKSKYDGPPPPAPTSIEEAYDQVRSNTDCVKTDYEWLAMTMYLCSETLTAWYFTMPDETLPPGWVRRVMYRDADNGIQMLTNSAYYGTDEQEPVFLAWITNIEATILANN